MLGGREYAARRRPETDHSARRLTKLPGRVGRVPYRAAKPWGQHKVLVQFSELWAEEIETRPERVRVATTTEGSRGGWPVG